MEVITLPVSALEPHPDQPRKEMGDLKGLAASIAAVGILQPLLVVRIPPMTDLHYRIVGGHRRAEAAKLAGLECVPCLVSETEERAHELAALMAENTARADLTPYEQARGFQTMMDLGADVELVAKVTGKSAEVVTSATKAVATASKKVELPALTFEHMAALAEFADDPVSLKTIEKAIAKGGNIAYTVTQEHQAQEKRARVKEAKAAIEAAGAVFVKDQWDFRTHPGMAHLNNLRDAEGKELTPETHAECPGRAASIDYWGAVVWLCLDAKKHGHTRVDGRREPTAEELKAQRMAAKFDADMTAAGELRRAFVRDAIATERKGMGEFVCDVFYALDVHLYNEDVKHAAEWFGTRKALKAAPLSQLFALLAADLESTIGQIRYPAECYSGKKRIARYLKLLQDWGYQLTPVEAGVLAEWAKPKEEPVEAGNSAQEPTEAPVEEEPHGVAEDAHSEDLEPEDIEEVD